jgi:hypothetical protein
MPGATIILAAVSIGELLDKISILKIKSVRVRDPEKRALVEVELSALNQVRADSVPDNAAVTKHCVDLQQVNESLWDIEDEIRAKELAQAFDADFIRLARAVYVTNDRRAAIKRALNESLGSGIVEVKEYGRAPLALKTG